MKYTAYIILLLLFVSCDSIKVDNGEELTIASFNIAWLGDGHDDKIDRVTNDYNIISDIIADANIDIWALQEIENTEALKLIADKLTGYSYYVGTHGGNLNLAYLYKNNIEVLSIEENMNISVEPGSTRPGLTAFVRKGNFDFMLMNVHFKSTSRYDDTEEKRKRSFRLRTEQAQEVKVWADSIVHSGIDQDLIILGDFNDYPARKKNNTILSLVNSNNFIFITEHIKSCKFNFLNSIDNILISNSAKERYVLNSAKTMNIRNGFTDEELKTISDHCPVTAKFEILSDDND